MSNAAELLIETLVKCGVDTIYGLPGDGINGIMEAIRTHQGRVRFIQVRHEESAAFMATAHAKLTGKLGCCLATSGPGGVHLLNGLYDAKCDGASVIAITGAPYHDLIDTLTQQDVDQSRLFADVAVYTTRIMSAAHVENVVTLACRTALSKRGVAHLSIPTDVQEEELAEAEPSSRNLAHHTSVVTAEGLQLPLSQSGAVLVEVTVDPNEPLLPPKRIEKYAANMETALKQGTPGAQQIRHSLGEQPSRTMLQS